jgi:hypothetical protein
MDHPRSDVHQPPQQTPRLGCGHQPALSSFRAFVDAILLTQLTGEEAAFHRELRKAHQLFTEIGAPIRAAEVAKELGLATAS